MKRKIIHVDMDAYYAAVEQRDRPELRGKPVIVGGSPNGRGVVATASYEARKFGIHSAMPSARAYRLCPHAVFVRGNFDKYRAISKQIREIFKQVSDQVEPLSLDEAYLDVTENHLGEKSATRVSQWIQKRILDETGLTASVGVSCLKFVAKVASDFKKPYGITVVPPAQVDPFISGLPIEKLWSVGPVTARRLRELGILKVGDIKKWDKETFCKRFGKHGSFIFNLAHGIDHRGIARRHGRKSHGSESTFGKNIGSIDRLLEVAKKKVHQLLESGNTVARTVTLKVRYSNFETITRSRTLPFATSDCDLVFSVVQNLMISETEIGEKSVRLLGVSLSNIGEGQQLWLPFKKFTTLVY